jgi:hypothetical protein
MQVAAPLVRPHQLKIKASSSESRDTMASTYLIPCTSYLFLIVQIPIL